MDIIGVGFASLYNHAVTPNAVFVLTQDAIIIRSSQAIAAGEEVTIDYGWSDGECRASGIPVPERAP
jgi:SET domain-containing protein